MDKPLRVATFNLEWSKKNALWGTYGKPITHPARWVRLIDCSTEHLQAILVELPLHGDDHNYTTIIQAILKDREVPA